MDMMIDIPVWFLIVQSIAVGVCLGVMLVFVLIGVAAFLVGRRNQRIAEEAMDELFRNVTPPPDGNGGYEA